MWSQRGCHGYEQHPALSRDNGDDRPNQHLLGCKRPESVRQPSYILKFSDNPDDHSDNPDYDLWGTANDFFDMDTAGSINVLGEPAFPDILHLWSSITGPAGRINVHDAASHDLLRSIIRWHATARWSNWRR